MTAPRLVIDHFSDTHLGFRQYPVMSGSGRNQREQDFSRAFKEVVDSIVDADSPLVIHAGDFFDNSRPSWRHVMQGLAGVRRIAADGRILVIAAGNHDMPADAAEACPVELFGHLPGVLVATNRYTVHDLGELVAAGKARPELADVVIHLLPHESLKTVAFEDVVPIDGKVNILVSHCVVGGSDLYKRSIGREYALPIEVVTRGWDYVALGHFHKQGPVAVGGFSETTTPAWYAGSTENNGFGDVHEGATNTRRGYLRVTLTDTGDPAARRALDVDPVDLPIRVMFDLPVLDASGLSHDQVSAELIARIEEADIKGAVVRQRVVGLHPDTWGLVDIAAARAAAKDCLWYETKPSFADISVHADGEEQQAFGDLAQMLATTLDDLFGKDQHREEITELAHKLLGASLLPAAAAEDSCCHGTDAPDEQHEHGEHEPSAPTHTGDEIAAAVAPHRPVDTVEELIEATTPTSDQPPGEPTGVQTA